MGEGTHPVFEFLKRNLPPGEGQGDELSWNFNKILVDKHGRPVRKFPSSFDQAELERAIASELQKTR